MKKKRSVLSSPRLDELKKKKNKALRRKVLLFSALAISIIIALSYLSRTDGVNISDIEVSGNKVVDADKIKDIINNKLGGYYLWIFPKTNFLLYPAGAITKELSTQFKRLDNISLSVKDAKVLNVSVTERDPKYIWCGVDVSATDQKCYFMDAGGYIFDTAPYFSGNVYLKFYGLARGRSTAEGNDDDLNQDDPTGRYFHKSIFQSLVKFESVSEEIGLKPTALYLTNDGDVNMFLSSNSALADSPKVIFKQTADFDKIADNLQTAITTEPLRSQFKTRYPSLLYIDLRFDGKVLYKFK